MAKVKINLLNIFYLQLKKKSVEYEGKTVNEVVKKFVKDYKDKLDDRLLSKNKKKLDSQILVLLNGKNVDLLKNSKTKLKDGDEIYLSIPLSGG
ncbi:MAG: hypothetical protein GF353_23580 [Candidatus Lokiarchaeota archaeon]|nr:hypothetical protein [Candidatus Lokiarchaeota archaeon]